MAAEPRIKFFALACSGLILLLLLLLLLLLVLLLLLLSGIEYM